MDNSKRRVKKILTTTDFQIKNKIQRYTIPLEFTDWSSPLTVAVNCNNQKIKKLVRRTFEQIKNYKIGKQI